jgi:hypothetical protein
MTSSRYTSPPGWWTTLGVFLTGLVVILAVLMAVGVVPFTAVIVGALFVLIALARFC